VTISTWKPAQSTDPINQHPRGPTSHHQTYILHLLLDHTNQSGVSGPLVTPSGSFNWQIALPVPGIEYRPPNSPIPLYYGTILAQFRTSLAPWQRPLFGPIQCLQSTHSILDANQEKGIISLISDASVQKTKQSSFAWILAHGS